MSIFTDDLKLREPTPEEQLELSENKELSDIQEFIRFKRRL